MRQGWRCEVCKARSSVSYKRDAGVYEVIQRLKASHQRRSPDCAGGMADLRVTDWRRALGRGGRGRKIGVRP
jgi:hypothetical protein